MKAVIPSPVKVAISLALVCVAHGNAITQLSPRSKRLSLTPKKTMDYDGISHVTGIKRAIMPEWSKGCDSSSHGCGRVGSNPTDSILQHWFCLAVLPTHSGLCLYFCVDTPLKYQSLVLGY